LHKVFLQQAGFSKVFRVCVGFGGDILKSKMIRLKFLFTKWVKASALDCHGIIIQLNSCRVSISTCDFPPRSASESPMRPVSVETNLHIRGGIQGLRSSAQ